MWILLILFLLVIFYPIWQPAIPKGSLFQELISLPDFWWRVSHVSKEGMRVTKHSFGTHSRQYLLCCEPLQGSVRKEVVIVYCHGGGWTFGTPEQFQSNAKFFVDLGYTVFLPSYRRLPFYSYPAIDEDIDLALLKIEALKQEKGMANARLLPGGMSAGGNVVGLMVFDKSRKERLGLKVNHFAGAFFFAAPLDLRGMYDSLLLYRFAGRRNSEKFKKANPVHHLGKAETLPLCIVHGDHDGMVPLEAATGFIQALADCHHGLLRYKELKGGSHLDAASWTYRDNEIRDFLYQWLKDSVESKRVD